MYDCQAYPALLLINYAEWWLLFR